MTRYVQFKFQVFSFNIPFMLRNLVPLLVLCFVSLMCYLAGASSIWDVYGNVILLIITLIQLLKNFSQSNYNTFSFNLFQANLFGIIIINVLLVIIATHNFYDSDVDVINLNAKNALFWISVAIGCFFVLSNLVVLIYFGIQKHKANQNMDDFCHKIQNRLIWN